MKRTLTILAVIMLAGSSLGFMTLIQRRRVAAVSAIADYAIVVLHNLLDNTDPTADESDVGSNTGDLVGGTWVSATNTISAHYAMAGITNYIATACTQDKAAYFVWADTNAYWNSYAYSDGTTYVNGVAASFNTNEVWVTEGNNIFWGTNAVCRKIDRCTVWPTGITVAAISSLHWDTAQTNGTTVTNYGYGRFAFDATYRSQWSNTVFASTFSQDNGGQDVSFVGTNHGTKGAGGATPTFMTEALGPTGNGYYSFDASDYLTVNGAVPYAQNNTVGTISLWAKIDNPNATYVIFGASDSGDANDWVILYYNHGDGKLWAGCFVGGASKWNDDFGVSVSTNTWYHVALVQDGTTPLMYVDGVAHSISAPPADATAWMAAVTDIDTVTWGVLKRGGAYDSYLLGDMDDCRIYTNNLSALQVTNLYNRGRE